MAMGRRKGEQTPMWVASTDLPVSPGHPFYAKLNAILDDAGFDRFAETECQQFYAPVMGRPSLAPGRYFRLLLVGYFEGLDSERGIAWRAADSLAVRNFVGLGLDTVDSATELGLPVDTRDYGPAARVLLYLGVRSVRLMSNNPDKLRALEEHGIKVVSRVPLLMPARVENIAYLTAKRDRLGHDLPHLDGSRG